MTPSISSFQCKLGIFIILLITPLIYSGIVSFLLQNLFNDGANKVMFLLYNTPFWFLLMFITGVELYRRAVTRRFTLIAPVYMLMMGSVVIGVTGIIICPVGPVLLSSDAFILISVNVTLAAVAGLVISKLFNNVCDK